MGKFNVDKEDFEECLKKVKSDSIKEAIKFVTKNKRV